MNNGQQSIFQPVKPTIVFVSNGITPYGTHYLERISAELPEFTLRTIYSYQFSMGHWNVKLPSAINAIIFGEGEDVTNLGGLISIRDSFKRYQQIVTEIKTLSPVAVIILGYGNLAHFLTIKWCHKNSIQCLLSADSNILGDNNTGIKAWIKSLVVSRVVSCCSAFLSCGNLGTQYFLKYGAHSKQIFLAPVEPDYSLVDNISKNIVESVASEFQLKPDRHRIIYSGRLIAIKRIDLLIDAFIQLAEDRPEWDLVIAGSGPLEAELKSKVPINLQPRVLWTGFIGAPQNMFALYRLSEVLALTSDYEPWALVVNEAVSEGLALVCSDVVGAAAELLRDGENGRFFVKGDVSSLETALRDVTDGKNLLRYRANSAQILHKWREDADPVAGLRLALEFCFQTSGVDSLPRQNKSSKSSKK